MVNQGIKDNSKVSSIETQLRAFKRIPDYITLIQVIAYTENKDWKNVKEVLNLPNTMRKGSILGFMRQINPIWYTLFEDNVSDNVKEAYRNVTGFDLVSDKWNRFRNLIEGGIVIRTEKRSIQNICNLLGVTYGAIHTKDYTERFIPTTNLKSRPYGKIKVNMGMRTNKRVDIIIGMDFEADASNEIAKIRYFVAFLQQNLKNFVNEFKRIKNWNPQYDTNEKIAFYFGKLYYLSHYNQFREPKAFNLVCNDMYEPINIGQRNQLNNIMIDWNDILQAYINAHNTLMQTSKDTLISLEFRIKYLGLFEDRYLIEERIEPIRDTTDINNIHNIDIELDYDDEFEFQ